MGRTPNVIFRELYRNAKKKIDKINSLDDNINKPMIAQISKEDHCYYVYYQDVVKAFMMEGYSEEKAVKHIMKWLDNDFLTARYMDKYKLIGIGDDVA